MGVKINIAPYLQRYTGNNAVVEVNGSQIGECLNQVVKQFPDIGEILYQENGELWPHVVIRVNLADIVNLADTNPGDLAKPVKDGDKVYIGYIFYHYSYAVSCC